MTEHKDESPKTELDELLKAYALAVVEFNLASAPLIVALTAGVRPSAADIKREENARTAWSRLGERFGHTKPKGGAEKKSAVGAGCRRGRLLRGDQPAKSSMQDLYL